MLNMSDLILFARNRAYVCKHTFQTLHTQTRVRTHIYIYMHRNILVDRQYISFDISLVYNDISFTEINNSNQ